MNSVIKRTTLIVRDIERSLAWYQHVLGMEVYYDQPVTLSGIGMAAGKAGDVTRLVILKCEHAEIGMIGLLQWLDPELEAPEIPTAVTYGMPTFVCGTDDCAALHRRATEQGARIHAEPHEWSVLGADGTTKYFVGCSLFDPDGHFYEVNQLLRSGD